MTNFERWTLRGAVGVLVVLLGWWGSGWNARLATLEVSDQRQAIEDTRINVQYEEILRRLSVIEQMMREERERASRDQERRFDAQENRLRNPLVVK